MKNTIKILIGISILFLLLGSAAALDINNLKVPDGYDNFKDGFANYTTNSNRYFNVEKIVELDDDFKDEWFNNHTDFKYMTAPVGDNIFYFEDGTFELYGYQEVVESDGTYYFVSINQGSKLSPSEKNEFLNDLKEFNKLNNLEPIAI